MKIIKYLVLPFVACLLAGCAHTTTYNPSYIRSAGITTVPRYSGKLLIYNTSQENNFIFKGGPESLTGFAWHLHVPLGEYTKGAAGEVYGHLFKLGYENSETINTDKNGKFSAIMHPAVENFAWRMNQAKNAGFAITPQVKNDPAFPVIIEHEHHLV